MPEFEVYVVWYCKTLQNHKALLSTSLTDGMYYELTFNGDKRELYLDAYKKFENKCIKVESEDQKMEEEKETKQKQAQKIDVIQGCNAMWRDRIRTWVF